MSLPSIATRELATLDRHLASHGLEMMVVGAASTFVWGEPRTTRDLDVAVLQGDRSGRGRPGVGVAGRRGGGTPLDSVRSIVHPLVRGGTPCGPRPLSGCPGVRAGPVAVDRGERLAFQSPEDLVINKLKGTRAFPAQRSRDLQDAAGVLRKQSKRLDQGLLNDLAREEGLGASLASLLDEVRVDHG